MTNAAARTLLIGLLLQAELAPAATSTSITLTSSQNPSLKGQRVTFTAKVEGGNPRGRVVFKDGDRNIFCDSGQRGKTYLNDVGLVNCTTGDLAAGAREITAEYRGIPGQYVRSTSAVLRQVVSLRPTTTAVSAVPSATPEDQTQTFTATVAGLAPTGRVVFHIGTFEVGAARLDGTGDARTASVVVKYFASGRYRITATYEGDQRNAGSISPAFVLTVKKGGASR